MKPNFALGLTDDGITLWHSSPRGWLRVGAVAIDSAKLDADMRAMAHMAMAIAPDGVQTKLVIPDDQILFETLPVHGKSDAEVQKSIRSQLEGRTPYPVEELEFDWIMSAGKARVAVVARETVLEAEEFANTYGLNPVVAVAAPAEAQFSQEPFFCATRAGRKAHARVSRSDFQRDRVIETGVATLPDPEPTRSASASATNPAAQTEESAVDRATGTPEATEKTEKPAKASQPAAEAKPSTSANAPDRKPETANEKAAAKAGPTSAIAAPRAATAGPKAERPSDVAAQLRKSALLAKLSAAKLGRDGAGGVVADARKGLSDLLSGKKSPADAATPPTPDAVAEPAGTFRSRRALPEGDTQRPARNAPPGLLGKLNAQMERGTTTLKSGLGGFRQKFSGSLRAKATLPKAATKGLAAALASRDTGTEQPTAAKTPPPEATTTGRARKDPLTTLRERGTSATSQSEAERLTVFGARNQDIQPGRNSGRGALLVLGGVALLLVAVALWAAYFYSIRPGPDQVAFEAPEISADLSGLGTDDASLAGQDDVAADLADIEAALGVEDAAQQQPVDDSTLAAQMGPATDPESQAAPRTEFEPLAGRIAGLRSMALLPPEEASAFPSAPAAPSPFGSTPLPPLRSEVAPQVSAPEVTETPPSEQTSVAPQPSLPAGEELLDITVASGAPTSTPPQRPDALVPEDVLAALQAERDLLLAPDPVPDTAIETPPPAVDPLDETDLDINVTQGQPSATPPARPEGIAPEPAEAPLDSDNALPEEEALEDDQARLDVTPPPGGLALNALRPVARPADAAVPAGALQPAERFPDASDLAVAASLRPDARPGQFAAIVERSLRSAEPQPATPSAPAPSAPVQTASAAVAAPSIPTSASVAREATQTRAINLRQVNLIGVMGTQSSRRALVRLSNGRVVTVRVGEQLDGGQVTAIGESELRYNRRGRDVVLRLAS